MEVDGPIPLITDSTFMAPAKKETMEGLKTKGLGKNNGLRIHYMVAVHAHTGDFLGITRLYVIGDDVKKIHPNMES